MRDLRTGTEDIPDDQKPVYPRWKYHATKPAVVVMNAEDESRLQGDWHNTPADVQNAMIATKEDKSDFDPERQADDLAAVDLDSIPEKKRPGRPSKKNKAGNGEGENNDKKETDKDEEFKSDEDLQKEAIDPTLDDKAEEVT